MLAEVLSAGAKQTCSSGRTAIDPLAVQPMFGDMGVSQGVYGNIFYTKPPYFRLVNGQEMNPASGTTHTSTSTHIGAWSLVLSHPRGVRSTPARFSLFAKAGLSSA